MACRGRRRGSGSPEKAERTVVLQLIEPESVQEGPDPVVPPGASNTGAACGSSVIWPSMRRMMWPAAAANSASCVAMMMVTPCSWRTSRRSLRMSAPVGESRFPAGSSARTRRGELIRAMATRCCCPPESRDGSARPQNQTEWGRWDSNPHWQDPKSCASAVGLRPRRRPVSLTDQIPSDQVISAWN